MTICVRILTRVSVFSVCLWILFAQNKATAQSVACIDIFNKAQDHMLPVLPLEHVEDYKVSLIQFSGVTPEMIKKFSAPDGALPALLKTFLQNNNEGIEIFIRNMYFHVFRSTSAEYHHINMLLRAIDNPNSAHYASKLKVFAKAKKGDWNAKKLIAISLLTLEQVMRDVFKDPSLDLLTQNGLFKVYGVTDVKSLDAQMALTGQYFKFYVYNGSGMNPLRKATLEISDELAGSPKTSALEPDGILMMLRAEQYLPQLSTLIEKLHLPTEREHHYLNMLKEYSTIKWLPWGNAQTMIWRKTLDQLNIYIHAYAERFPQDTTADLDKRMKGRWFLTALATTERFDAVYRINEERLATNLETALHLNHQIDILLLDIQAALQTELRLQYPHQNFLKALTEIKSEALSLKIVDLTLEDISFHLPKLHVLQFKLSQLMDKILTDVANENIETLLELNFSWERVLVDKRYALDGRDYDHVIFEKDVVHYLKHEPLVGDLSLAALNKGYVGRHGESGLRYISKIHKDLRYVKLMKGRKVRLIGKLKNRTLHFFAIYERDESFDHKWLHNLIESH